MAGTLKAKELKAIEWYVNNYHLKPLLSTPPTMYFKDKDGKVVKETLNGILLEYNAWNDQDKKERSRTKRVADFKKVVRRFGS